MWSINNSMDMFLSQVQVMLHNPQQSYLMHLQQLQHQQVVLIFQENIDSITLNTDLIVVRQEMVSLQQLL